VARASAMIGLGLLLALAATIAPLPPPADVPGASLTVRLPALVQTIVLALFALSALLLLFLQRPRPPVEGTVPLRARRRPSTWTAFLSLLPFLALLGIAWYYVAHHGPGEDTHGIERAITAIVGLMDLLAFARKPPTSIPLVDATVAALVLAFALALFALLLLVTFAARLEAWWAARAARDATPSPPDEPVVTLDDPRLEPDPRRAVILAWARVERALAGARAPRAPWQTPAELTRVALARLPLPEGAVRRLTGLFEIARFSDRPLGGEARAAACACLDEITAALAEHTARAR
jgi:Domain of unknown function (DUF4129)